LLMLFILLLSAMRATCNRKEIAYAGSDGTDWEIYTINANGRGQRQLTHNDKDEDYPSWGSRGVDLRPTNLTDADLSYADLTNADLTDATLANARVTNEQLQKAESLEGAPCQTARSTRTGSRLRARRRGRPPTVLDRC
jgi:hypothetical protein